MQASGSPALLIPHWPPEEAMLCQIPGVGLPLHSGKCLRWHLPVGDLGAQSRFGLLLPCPGANTAHACAYFQVDSRGPTLGHSSLGPDGENARLSLPGPAQTEELLTGQGKMINPTSTLFSQGKIFTCSFQNVPTAETSLKTDVNQPDSPLLLTEVLL